MLVVLTLLSPSVSLAKGERRVVNLKDVYAVCKDMAKPSGLSLCVDMLTGWENDSAELDQLREKVKETSDPLLQTKYDKCRMDMVLIKAAVKNIGETDGK